MEPWLIINGSPRVNGKSARVVGMLSALIREKHSEVELSQFDVATCRVAGCNGCEYCKTAGKCVINDDMAELLSLLERAQRVVLVAPVYFTGAPSQLKAVLDRLQVYFWPYLERKRAGLPLPAKRPLSLFVVGDGGDPHGFEPLVVSVKSAFALAGFCIEETVPLVGIAHIKPQHLGRWGR